MYLCVCVQMKRDEGEEGWNGKWRPQRNANVYNWIRASALRMCCDFTIFHLWIAALRFCRLYYSSYSTFFLFAVVVLRLLSLLVDVAAAAFFCYANGFASVCLACRFGLLLLLLLESWHKSFSLHDYISSFPGTDTGPIPRRVIVVFLVVVVVVEDNVIFAVLQSTLIVQQKRQQHTNVNERPSFTQWFQS